MLPDEMHQKLGTSQTLCSVQSKEAERQELNRLVEEFEAKGGHIDRVPSFHWKLESLSYNRQGPINPAKRQKVWSNDGLAKGYRVR